MSIDGAWLPDLFIGTMRNVQRFDAGTDDQPDSAVDDAIETKALVEAAAGRMP